MAKKKVQAVSFDDLKKLVVNEAKNNNNVLTQEQIDEYLNSQKNYLNIFNKIKLPFLMMI